MKIIWVLLLSSLLGFAQEIDAKTTSVDTQKVALEKMGFRNLPKAEYLKIMEKTSYRHTKIFANNIWYIHEGDLTISPDEVKFFTGLSFLITGNLTVEGLFDYTDISVLFVLGDVKAKSILLSSSECYFAKTTYIDEALMVMGGSGALVVINDVSGPFVFNDSDAAEIKVDEKRVKIFLNEPSDEREYRYFGDFERYLESRFFYIVDEAEQAEDVDADYDFVEGDYVSLESASKLYRAILNGEKILKTNE